jgi:hypothetical protein
MSDAETADAPERAAAPAEEGEWDDVDELFRGG